MKIDQFVEALRSGEGYAFDTYGNLKRDSCAVALIGEGPNALRAKGWSPWGELWV